MYFHSGLFRNVFSGVKESITGILNCGLSSCNNYQFIFLLRMYIVNCNRDPPPPLGLLKCVLWLCNSPILSKVKSTMVYI